MEDAITTESVIQAMAEGTEETSGQPETGPRVEPGTF